MKKPIDSPRQDPTPAAPRAPGRKVLRLHRETLRSLTDQDLQGIGGGWHTGPTYSCPPCGPSGGCPTVVLC